MTETKGQLIYLVKTKAKLDTIDTKISNRFIWSLIEKHLKWLLKRENSKKNLIDQHSIFQTYKCVDVDEAPAIDDCCGVKGKCTVRRTAIKVPEIYEDTNGKIIKSVFSIDGSQEFIQISVFDYMRKLENPTTLKYDKTKYYYFNNSYLYFPNYDIRKVMIKAYFKVEIINECDEYCSTNSKKCLSLADTPHRVPENILGELLDFVSKDLSERYRIPTDTTQNKNDQE